MNEIIKFWNNSKLELQDKLTIILLQLQDHKKESKIYKDTKDFLKLIERG